MNATSTPSCLCTDCPGTDCRCGCNDRTPPVALGASATCACGPRCGCDAAEQGCLCGILPS